jgi:YcxB-like protein
MTAPLVLEFALSEPEYIDANMRLSRRRLLTSIAIQSGTAVTVGALVLSAAAPPEVLVWIVPVSFAVSAAIQYPLKRDALIRRFRSNGLEEVSRITLSADGYRSETASAQLHLRWRAFSHYVETTTTFLLYLDPESALILPKRVVNESQLEDVRRLLRDCIGHTRYTPAIRAFPVAAAPAAPVEPEGMSGSGG